MEKKRRDNLKFLYNHLFSLLPTHISLQGMSLPDQVGEAVKYIESLQNQVEKSKQKKQELLQQQNINTRKRPHHSSSSSSSCCNSTIQVLDMGSGMDVVLIDGLEDTAAFRNILRVLHEHGLEVATATFQPRGNSTLHIVHQQGLEGTTTVYEKLKQVVNGSSSCSEVEEPAESSVDSWYYDIWGFPKVETLPGQPHNPPPY